MGEIQEAFEIYQEGRKASNFLPTEKICPECGGSGFRWAPKSDNDIESHCLHCKNGLIQIYYTPEMYKEITGKDFPEGGAVWVKLEGVVIDDKLTDMWIVCTYIIAKDRYYDEGKFYIVQTAQGVPEPDYRPEV